MQESLSAKRGSILRYDPCGSDSRSNVGGGGLVVAPEKLQAISNFPKPANKTELRSFMGLLEQLAGFFSEVATTKTSLRPLLSSRNVWKPDQEIAFVEVKVLSRVEGASSAGLFQPDPRHSAPGDRFT